MLGEGNLAGEKLGNDRQNIFLRDFELYFRAKPTTDKNRNNLFLRHREAEIAVVWACLEGADTVLHGEWYSRQLSALGNARSAELTAWTTSPSVVSAKVVGKGWTLTVEIETLIKSIASNETCEEASAAGRRPLPGLHPAT